jgi:hypothetical protein
VVKEILSIAKQQYTPIPFLEPDAKDHHKAKALNNYQLIAFMENIRPGMWLVGWFGVLFRMDSNVYFALVIPLID